MRAARSVTQKDRVVGKKDKHYDQSRCRSLIVRETPSKKTIKNPDLRSQTATQKYEQEAETESRPPGVMIENCS